MDVFLLVLVTVCFILGITFGLSPIWLIGSTVLVLLIYLGLQYPNGLKDWKYSSIETLYTLSTMVTMLLMVYVIHLSATAIKIPGSNEITIAVTLLGFMVLFLMGLFYPVGSKLRISKPPEK